MLRDGEKGPSVLALASQATRMTSLVVSPRFIAVTITYDCQMSMDILPKFMSALVSHTNNEAIDL